MRIEVWNDGNGVIVECDDAASVPGTLKWLMKELATKPSDEAPQPDPDEINTMSESEG